MNYDSGENKKLRGMLETLRTELAESHKLVERLTADKNNAYSERNKLVSTISKLFPSSLERHPDEDMSWENDWRWIVFIDIPSGQVSWHIHDSELPQFRHLGRFEGRKWDGHSTEEKYSRLAALSPTAPADHDAECKEKK